MQKHNLTCDNKNVLSQWKKILLASAIKINQKIGLFLKTTVTHSVTILAASSRYRRAKAPADTYGIGKRKPLRASVSFVWAASQGGVVRGRVEKATGGKKGKEKKFFHICPAWGPKYVALSSSPRHQPSVLACHYFTSRRGHTLSLRHTYGLFHQHTLPVLPWSTLKFCQHQILKCGQVKQNERKDRAL